MCNIHKCLPNFRKRFCTVNLKIEPAESFYADNDPCISYIGLRADEQGRMGNKDTESNTRYPLREWGWGLKEVLSYLQNKKITIPARTDCARCFFQKKHE